MLFPRDEVLVALLLTAEPDSDSSSATGICQEGKHIIALARIGTIGFFFFF